MCFKENSWFQLGVVSTGVGCAEPGNAGVYTDVRKYSEWIEGKLINSKTFRFY